MANITNLHNLSNVKFYLSHAESEKLCFHFCLLQGIAKLIYGHLEKIKKRSVAGYLYNCCLYIYWLCNCYNERLSTTLLPQAALPLVFVVDYLCTCLILGVANKYISVSPTITIQISGHLFVKIGAKIEKVLFLIAPCLKMIGLILSPLQNIKILEVWKNVKNENTFLLLFDFCCFHRKFA